MRNSAKILALLLVLALCVTGIVLAVSADEPAAQAITEPTFAGVLPTNATITLDETVAAQLTTAGYVALQFADEAEFLAAQAAGYDALAAKGMTTFAHPATSCYVYLLTDVGGATMTAVNGVTQLFNLGGKTLAYTTAGGNSNGTDEKITYFNGTFNENRTGGHGLHRIQGYSEPKTYSLAFVNATVITNGSRPYSAESVRTFNLYFENSTINVNGSIFALMGFNATQTPNVNAIFKGTTINTKNVMFTFSAAAGASSTVYLDSECVVNGALYDKGTASHVTTTVENGCKINGAALTLFNNTAATTLVTESGVEFVDTGAHYTLMTPPVIPDDTTFTASADFKTANGKFVVYASEFDFYADLEGGVIDGLVDGKSVIVDDNGDTFPSSGYVCMLADYTLQPASTISVTGKLKINLGGTILTEKGVGGASGNNLKVATIAIPAGGTLGIYNGKFIDGIHSGQASNTLEAGATLEVKNVTLEAKQTWENWSSTFRFNGTADISFENCDVVQGKQVTVVYLASATTYNVDLKGVRYTDSATHTIVGTTTVDKDGDSVKETTVNRLPDNSAYHGFIATSVAATINISVDKDCVVNSGHLVNTSKSGANITLNAEIGFKTWSIDYTTAYVRAAIDAVTNGYEWQNGADAYTAFTIVDTLNFVQNGEVVTGDNISFVQDGSLYTLAKSDAKVNWYDEKGNLLGTTSHVIGDVPAYEYAPEIGAFEISGGKVYLTTVGGWATTAGGTATEITAIGEGETERSYYCIVEKTQAAVAVFTDDTCTTVQTAWVDASLTRAQWGAFADGAYVKFYADIEAEPNGAKGNASRFNNLAGDVTIDLGGYTLSVVHDKTVGTTKRISANGHVLTMKNGNITFNGDGAYQNLFEESKGGTIVLDGANITGTNATGPLCDFRYANLEIYGGSINYVTTIFSFQVQGGSDNVATINAKFYGVDMTAGNDGSIMNTHASNKVTIGDTVTEKIAKLTLVVDDLDGVASEFTGANFFRFDGVEQVSNQTTYTITVNDAKINASNAVLSRNDTKWFTWYDADSNSFVTDTALEASNINVSFTNVFTNRGIAGVGNATVNTGIRQDIASGGDYAHLYGVDPKVDAMNANLTLYSDFNLNLFIPKSANITAIYFGDACIFSVADGIYDTYGEDTYKVTISGITPNTAAKYIVLDIYYTNDDMTLVATAKYSVIKYAADLIATEDANSVAAMKALLGYVDAAYDNFDGDESDAAVVALLEELITDNGVAAFLAGYAPKASEGDTDFVTVTGVTAAFQIGTVSKLYVTFPADAEWSIVGDKLTKTGKGGECVINLPAYALTDVLTITVGGETATFSFGEYAEYLMNDGIDNATEDAVLVAMYAYGETARALKAQVDAENA